MRARTFILLILVLIIGGIAVVLLVATLSGGGGLAAITGGGGNAQTTQVAEDIAAEPALPTPTPTPAFEQVVVAKVRLPVGQIITEQLLDVELRPVNNVALQGGYTYTNTQDLVNRIVKVEVAKGQEILQPMIALNPTDISSFGSDLALYVPEGEVAVAFPINRFSGASLAMRPGDKVDMVMTIRTVEIDPEFRSALPNNVERVIQSALLAGQEFLFPPVQEGRLEFIPEVNQVAAIVPNSTDFVLGQDWFPGDPIPKRVTQLTIQQANVLYVGTWQDPRILEQEQAIAQANAEATAQAGNDGTVGEGDAEGGGGGASAPTPTPIPSRLEKNPDMVIISMSLQDALALKYARERGVQIDLVLRSPGDQTAFVTTSVSLPQIIDQGGLAIPEESDFDLYDSLIP